MTRYLKIIGTVSVWFLAWCQPITSLQPDAQGSHHDDSDLLDKAKIRRSKDALTMRSLAAQDKLPQCPKEMACRFWYVKGTKMHKKRANGRICVQGCLVASTCFYLQRGWQCGDCPNKPPMAPPAKAPVPVPIQTPKTPTAAPLVNKDPPKAPTATPIKSPTKEPAIVSTKAMDWSHLP
jgi:hypothetical protein